MSRLEALRQGVRTREDKFLISRMKIPRCIAILGFTGSPLRLMQRECVRPKFRSP